MRTRARAQSLVELALVAPILILLAMSVWDGGSAVRDQVVLQQAARDGARAAATNYAGSVDTTLVTNAVLASANADLPGFSSTPGFARVSYPDAQSVRVDVTYNHALITPVLRQVWGGSLTLSASATFFLPQLTPVPATLVMTPTFTATPQPTVATSTPTALATATNTATATPRPSNTPTATPLPTNTATPSPTPIANPCVALPAVQTVSALNNNTGYWCTVQLAATSLISATWFDNSDPNNSVSIYQGIPAALAGADPSSASPPSGAISTSFRVGPSIFATTTTCRAAGFYTIYFFNRGSDFSASSAWIAVQSNTC